jgi:hypothetical protein
MSGETPPPYLVTAAYDALKEEADFYKALQKELPDIYQYLTRMEEWLDRNDKTF